MIESRRMRSLIGPWRFLPVVLILTAGCATPDNGDLVGAWRSKLQFQSGDFAAIRDLEFMYVFNPGGTMTESSNYDAAPPVAPAYGVWRATGPGRYEARYEFFVTRAPDSLAFLVKGGGWLPAGRGILTEEITLAEDGRRFTSQVRYAPFDAAGKPCAGGGEAIGHGERIGFSPDRLN
jgi:hypothetical protein